MRKFAADFKQKLDVKFGFKRSESVRINSRYGAIVDVVATTGIAVALLLVYIYIYNIGLVAPNCFALILRSNAPDNMVEITREHNRKNTEIG